MDLKVIEALLFPLGGGNRSLPPFIVRENYVYFKQETDDYSPSNAHRIAGFLVFWDGKEKDGLPELKLALIPSSYNNRGLLNLLQDREGLSVELINYTKAPRLISSRISRAQGAASGDRQISLRAKNILQGGYSKLGSILPTLMEERKDYYLVGVKVDNPNAPFRATMGYLANLNLITPVSMQALDIVLEHIAISHRTMKAELRKIFPHQQAQAKE
jgi:hypothetical protein